MVMRGRVRSLRARLVATVLLLFTLACLAIGVVTSLSLQHFLDGRQDRDVAMGLERFERSRTGRLPPPPGLSGQLPGPQQVDFLGPGQGPGSIGAVLDPSGSGTRSEQVDRNGVRSTISGDDMARLAAVSPDGSPRDVDLSFGAYRVAAAIGPDGLTYVLGRPQGDVADVLGRLLVTEVLVLGATLVLAGVAAAVLVRRELRPLERVAGVAGRVGALPLDRGEVHLAARVPQPDPRTEVGQVGAALNHMLDNVEGALAARQESETRLRQFVADAGHELRTPLAAIRGYAELSRREPEPVPAGTTHALTRISSQAERMSTLVEDLLLLARLDAGRPLAREQVDLTRLVLDAIGDAHVAGPGHSWRPDLPDEPVLVTGDPDRLTQVLTNLLANARTHTPPGTRVTVGLRGGDGGGAELTVADSGPGIDPAMAPRVFERFARAESSRSRAGNDTQSTGLGLAIVSAVVAAHEGTVSVRSVPGETVFTVWLPPG